MSAVQKGFAPDEFVERLRSGELAAPLTFVGMAKEAEDDGRLLFAGGTACEAWIEIPLALIERVEVVGTVPCRDHAHPLVQLQLKEPDSEEGRVLAALARAAGSTRAGVGTPGGRRGAGPPPSLRRGLGDASGGSGSCAACFEFCRELIPNPEFGDFLWTLGFCEGLCPG